MSADHAKTSTPAPAEVGHAPAHAPAVANDNKPKDKIPEKHADATHAAVDKALSPHSGAATLELLSKEKDVAKKKLLCEKLELTKDEAKNEKLIHDMKEAAGDETNKHLIDEKVKAAKESKEEKKDEKEKPHGPQNEHDQKKAEPAHPPEPAAAHATPTPATHPEEVHNNEDAEPPGILRSFWNPVGATIKTGWTTLKTLGTLGLGSIPFFGSWFRKKYEGANLIKRKPPVAEAKKSAATPAHSPAEAHH